MTRGGTEETCRGQQRTEGRSGDMEPSFTTLSTIAIQAGQSRIVVSVLKSGAGVHLQLVQVHPGLCEIGSNREENQTLIQEQQQLLQKLKKHEREVLSAVEKSHQTEERRRRRDEEQEEEEEGVYVAMAASLTEGWSLLLHLLRKRQEVLNLASDFYSRSLEFAVSIDRVEDLQTGPDPGGPTEVQLTYDSMRRDLLGKSLQVLTSSSVLLQKLRQLQRTEALQRRGGVLQDEEEEEESSQCSRGVALRLEELVETLQDRRRRADQAVRLHLQQMETGMRRDRESRPAGSEDWSLAGEGFLEPILQSGSASLGSTRLRSDSSDLQRGPSPEETRNPKSRSTSTPTPTGITELRSDSRDLQPGPRPEETGNLLSGFKLNWKAGSRSDPKSDSKSEGTRDLQSRSCLDQTLGSKSDLQPGSALDVKPKSRSDQTEELDPRFRLMDSRNLQSESTSEESTDLQPGPRLEETRELIILEQTPGFKPDIQPGSTLDETPESRLKRTGDMRPGFRLEDTRNLHSGSTSTQSSELETDSGVNDTKNLESGTRPKETGILQSEFKLNFKAESRSEESADLQPRPRSDGKQRPGCRSVQTRELCPESTSQETTNLQPEPRSEETTDLQSRSRSLLKYDSRSEETTALQSQSRSVLKPDSRSEDEDFSSSELNRKQEVTKQHRAAATNKASGQTAGLESILGSETQSGEDHAHQALLTNERQQLLSPCARLVDKIWSSVQQGHSVLSNSSEAGQRLFEAEDNLKTHLQLHAQAESAGQDAENLKQILDQIRALDPDRACEPSRQLTPLKALTEQLKRRTSAARPGPPAADRSPSLSPELADKADLVLKELQSLKRKIESNLRLLKPTVAFLRTAQQVEEEMKEVRELHMRSPEEEEEEEEERAARVKGRTMSSRSPAKKKQVDACWGATLQKFLAAQELGGNLVLTVPTVSGAALNLQSVVSVVQQTLERLSRTKQEVDELRRQHQVQIQEQQEFCRKYRERLLKTLQDLNGVSELLDSCTLMDLGSEPETSRLLKRFSQARPHFTQLDAEVEYVEKSWESLRGVQDRLEVEGLKGKVVKEEDLSEVLKLQKKVKTKLHQSESILDLTSRFHLTSRQLEALLQSDLSAPLTGSAGLCGSSEAEPTRQKEDQRRVQSLFETASTLKTDICSAVSRSGWTGFRVEQLEARLLSLDSLRVSRLNEAAGREEKLRRDLLTRRLNDDISQLRDSFKELKKRFSNLKFNYLKRNDRTRNTKATRNQLQQMELYEEKLQLLRKRLHGVTARLGSEVKDGGVAREAEDAVNELHRQMGDFERSVSDHQKTLQMTRRLQQAMEEYQFWCEEASATIARVGKFSSECRSTDAVSVLYQQFEKFVWPTVPEQEERISQIAELAVRLHGAEEGRRYIERTVSKHSEMVGSIRELSDRLMELEAKLKLEALRKQQNNEDKEAERRDDTEEKKLKENRKTKKKEQTDNRSTQEAADVTELKETGHTPELTAEHDGKEVPVKRQNAANRKPPLQKSRSQEAERRRQTVSSETFTSSYDSTHTVSLSCSPVGANRQIHTIHSQLQSAATEPQAVAPPPVIGPLFSDIRREFQKKEAQETDAPAGGLSEAELQQQDDEVMTEDSLSNDEYECASPDDISLPPLAETPESNMVQSDVEEGCFSSHSAHTNQHSHQCHAQSEHSGTGAGAVRQLRVSSQTESCPTPPSRRHSSTRFRSESSSFSQSPLIASTPPAHILKTSEDNTASVPQSAHLSMESPEPNQIDKNKTPDSCSRKDNVPEKKNFLQTELSSQCNQPQKSTGTQVKITQNVASKGETLRQTDPIIPQSSCCPQLFNGPDPDLHKDKTSLQDSRILKCGSTSAISFPQSLADCESVFHQDTSAFQTREETASVSKTQRTSLTNTSTSAITKRTFYLQSSPSLGQSTLAQSSSRLSSPQELPFSQRETQIDPVPQVSWFAQSPNLTDSVPRKNTTQDTGFTIVPRDSSLPQAYLDSSSVIDQDVPLSQTNQEISSVSMSRRNNLTTATVNQTHIRCESSPLISHGNVPGNSSSPRSKQGSPLSQGDGGLLKVHVPIPSQANLFNNISSSSSAIRFGSHETVYSLDERLTSTCTQRCVHDPGMTPSRPVSTTGAPQPEFQTQALAQHSNLHDTSLSSPLHLLTPDQDTDICQPVAIREEIKLTRQIRGPPLPASPALSPAQAETLPLGKASKLGPPCFTRPLSKATVMEGAPVTLEVEVTGHPEPSLTWFGDIEMSATSEDRKHFLSIPEMPCSGGGLHEGGASNQQHANSCSGGDKWLMDEVFDAITADWQTWFSTLCVLLWLLYLIVL